MSTSGFFMGVHAGHIYTNSKLSISSTAPVAAAAGVSVTKNGKSKSNAILGGISLGFLPKVSDQFRVGLELEGSMDSTKVVLNDLINTGNDFDMDIKRVFTFIPSFVVSGELNEQFRLIFKAGVAITTVRATITNSTDHITEDNGHVILGLVPALGLEYMMSNQSAITLTHSMEIYQKARIFSDGMVSGGTQSNINVAYAHLQSHSTKIGFKYYF